MHHVCVYVLSLFGPNHVGRGGISMEFLETQKPVSSIKKFSFLCPHLRETNETILIKKSFLLPKKNDLAFFKTNKSYKIIRGLSKVNFFEEYLVTVFTHFHQKQVSF